MTITSDPNHPGINKQRADGQNEAYLVLSEEERRLGYKRPLRYAYIHTGQKPRYPLRDLTPAEKERYGNPDYIKYEEYPPSDSSVIGRAWTAAQLKGGCGTVTTIGSAIAETYSRDPQFYGSTFCCQCGKHFPVAEFSWEDGSTLGS